MKLIKTELPAGVKLLSSKTKPQLIIEEFLNSDADCVECVIENGEYKDASSASTTFIASIKRYGYTCKVRTRAGKMYLIKPALRSAE